MRPDDPERPLWDALDDLYHGRPVRFGENVSGMVAVSEHARVLGYGHLQVCDDDGWVLVPQEAG